MGGFGYEKPELLKIAEQIYECKEKKRNLELELNNEKFHCDYIPKRKNFLEHKVVFRLLFIIPLTVIVLCIAGGMLVLLTDSSSFSGEGGGGAGLFLLFATLIIVGGGYLDAKLLMQEARMLHLIFTNTFQRDEEKSKEKISSMEEEIAFWNEKAEELIKKQQQLILEKEKREEVLRKKGILFDENPNAPDAKFSLKEESAGTQDALQLHEYYSHEEQYINNYLIQLDGKLQRINKKIIDIDDDFENVKKQLFFSVIIYIIIVIIQSVFTGVLSVVTNILCAIASLFYAFYFENKCKRPILLYMVEYDSNLTKEYAFCNNMVPVRNERRELLEIIEQSKKELVEIKKKKSEIVF